MVSAIFDHRGTVDKFIGDAVMANFGTPKSYGNDAQNAFNCAVSMNQKLKAWNKNREKKNLIYDSEKKTSIWHSTSNVMDDSVIDPRNTRDYLRLCLEIIYKEDIKGSDSFGTFRM